MDTKIQSEHINLRLSSYLLRDVKKVKGSSTSDKIKRILIAGLNNQTLDNSDYSEIINTMFELKTQIVPIGSNLNQLTLYLNQGNELNNITNLDVLDDLKPLVKESVKLMKYLQKEFKAKQ